MPVKIVLYAEDIATGTEIVNFALKVGGALSMYDPNSKAPIKRNSTAGARSESIRALQVVPGITFRGKDTLKEQAYKVLGKAFGNDKFSIKAAHEALDAANWDEAQGKAAVHGLRKTGHLTSG
jgi:hypothetical protein